MILYTESLRKMFVARNRRGLRPPTAHATFEPRGDVR